VSCGFGSLAEPIHYIQSWATVTDASNDYRWWQIIRRNLLLQLALTLDEFGITLWIRTDRETVNVMLFFWTHNPRPTSSSDFRRFELYVYGCLVGDMIFELSYGKVHHFGCNTVVSVIISACVDFSVLIVTLAPGKAVVIHLWWFL
jgi:hypothetical protein